jgi:hypothetical protein
MLDFEAPPLFIGTYKFKLINITTGKMVLETTSKR